LERIATLALILVNGREFVQEGTNNAGSIVVARVSKRVSAADFIPAFAEPKTFNEALDTFVILVSIEDYFTR